VPVGIELLHHLRARLRKVTDQPDVISETHQKYSVLWAQDVFQEDLKVTLMLLGELILASAEVDDQPERQGNIDTVGKERDFLRHSVLEDFDVVFGQVLNQSAARIAGGEGDVHQSDVNADRFLS
jgi:hypothetical protein